jgi:hypothetical protein
MRARAGKRACAVHASNFEEALVAPNKKTARSSCSDLGRAQRPLPRLLLGRLRKFLHIIGVRAFA